MSEALAAQADRRAAARRSGVDHRGSPRGHGRYSPIPPLPSLPRSELAVLRDHGGPLGVLLWQCLSDVLLWCAATQRAGLFQPRGPAHAEALAYTLRDVPELADPVSELLQVSAMPELALAERVAEACEQVMRWAEQHGMKETAAQYAEAAARLEPERSSRCYTAGRTCRHVGDAGRSAMWFRRAERLARRAGSQIDFAIAHLGFGSLCFNLGRHDEAETHIEKAIRAALRAGRRSLAGSAAHDLMCVCFETGQLSAAEQQSRRALELYPARHPRLAVFAHDVALIWVRLGYFSSALMILEKVAPLLEGQPERILAMASLARAAAAVHDHIRYERASAEVLRLLTRDTERGASSLYHLAEGARSFQHQDRARAYARRALELANQWENRTVVALATDLVRSLDAQELGDVDTVPAEGSPVDRMTDELVRRLARLATARRGKSPAAIPPEDFPVD
jgi:tetratricopeptide (TPR) repeat protein